MVISCSALGCNNRQQKTSNENSFIKYEQHVSFHRFPVKNEELLSQWENAVQRDDWTPTKYSYLCSSHFEQDCYVHRPAAAYPILKKTAVPTIFDRPTDHVARKRSRYILPAGQELSAINISIAKHFRGSSAPLKSGSPNGEEAGSTEIIEDMAVATQKMENDGGMDDDVVMLDFNDNHRPANVKQKATRERKTYETAVRQLRKIAIRSDEQKKTETTGRETRKMARKTYSERRTFLFDATGMHFRTGKDMCDCLEEFCPGCHYPCPRCKSPKCAHECRMHRRWMYGQLEVEGTDIVVQNPILKL